MHQIVAFFVITCYNYGIINYKEITNMSIVLIHLTDIHMNSKKENAVLNKVKALSDAINSIITKKDTVIFTITGDLAYAGLSDEYNIVTNFLNEIKQNIQSKLDSKPHFLIVPGNHDCHFDPNNTIRSTIISSYTHNRQIPEDIPEDAMEQILAPQKNYRFFSEQYDLSDNIITTKEILCQDDKKLLFILINSSWISKYHEESGTLFIPTKFFPNIDITKYDCILTLMHHPINWFNPDNAYILNKFIRTSTDILLLGHEHNKDDFNVNGHSWSFTEKKGKELQNSSDANDSMFSIYKLDNTLSSIETSDFQWDVNLKLYKHQNTYTDAFSRNSYADDLQVFPNSNFMKQLNNIDIFVKHPSGNNIKLPDVFCWPTLEILNFESEKYINTYDNEEAITNQLLLSPISLIIGDSLSGKTALAKMLFISFLHNNKKCLSCSGDIFTSSKSASVDKVLNDLIIKEYNENNLDSYLQTDRSQKVFFIDDFNKISLTISHRCTLLHYLSEKFENIIVFMDSSTEAFSQITTLKKQFSIEYSLYKITPLGNVKRREFISNWLRIGKNDCDTIEFENTTDKTLKKVNRVLGSNKFIVPSSPAYLLNLLQDLNSTEASFKGSQYGFLYESLVQKSLAGIDYNSVGDFNIDISVISELAFKMLQDRKSIVSYDDIGIAIIASNTKHKIKVSCDRLLNNMISGNILVDAGAKNYKFKYPYLFYYFTGRYIAHNISSPEVKQQVEYMSQRLYTEDYGNILIFACHFSNSNEIIEDVLVSAYCLLDKYQPFDFTNHLSLFSNAKQLIEKILVCSNVGDENSIIHNRNKALELKDKIGVSNGEMEEMADFIDDSISTEDKMFAEFSSAQKTMEVLGQIISNYPGDIDGKSKLEIIDEIHMLGMRLIES